MDARHRSCGDAVRTAEKKEPGKKFIAGDLNSALPRFGLRRRRLIRRIRDRSIHSWLYGLGPDFPDDFRFHMNDCCFFGRLESLVDLESGGCRRLCAHWFPAHAVRCISSVGCTLSVTGYLTVLRAAAAALLLSRRAVCRFY